MIETFVPFTAHKCESPLRSVETTPSELFPFFRVIAMMRRMEIAADSLYKAKLIHGFCHLYDSQKVVTVSMEAVTTKKDSIITVYRDHCTFLNFFEFMGLKFCKICLGCWDFLGLWVAKNCLEFFGLFMCWCVVIFLALTFVKVPWMVGRRL